MNITKKLLFLLLLPIASGTRAAEFEVLDRFSVDGYTVLKGSADIPGGSFSVGGSTLVVKNGNIGIGTAAPKNKLDVGGSAAIGATYSGTSAGPANGLIVEGNVGIGTAGPGVKLDVQDINNWNNSSALNVTRTQNANSGIGKAIVADITTAGTPGATTLYGLYADSYITGGSGAAYGVYVNRGFSYFGGNVGIGTTAPSASLDVAGSARLTGSVSLPTDGAQINFANSGNNGQISSNGGTLTVSNGAGVSGSDVIVLNASSGGRQILIKSDISRFANSTGATEYARFASNGNVGIGTTAPGAKLHVNYGNTPVAAAESLRLEVAGNASTDRGPYLSFFAPNNSGTSKESANIAGVQSAIDGGGALIFKTSPSGAGTMPAERVRIDNSGNVGIGTAAPAAKLQVSGGRIYDIANGEPYSFAAQYGPAAGQFYFGATNASAADGVFSNSGGAERMRITDGGNIGIGTDNPGGSPPPNAVAPRILQVWNGSGAPVISGRYYSVAYGFDIWSGTTGLSPMYIDQLQNDDIIFRTSTYYTASEKMRITSGGNIGIGTTAPGTKLDVAGVIHAADLSLDNIATLGTPHWGVEGMDYLALRTYGGVNILGNSINVGKLTIGAWAQNAPGSGLYVGGDSSLMGSVGIGTSSPAGKLEVAGGDLLIGGNLSGVGSAATVRIHLGGGSPGPSNSGVAAAWNIHSSIRWKKDITEFTGALGIIKSLRPVRYTWKADGGKDIGFIAEEVRAVLPEIVLGDPKDTQYAIGLDYARLTAVLTAAMQDMGKVIDISSAPAGHSSIFIGADGNIGAGTSNPQRTMHINDVLRLEPRSAPPEAPSEGDIYVNSSDHHLYCYLGGNWKRLDGTD